ncbi:MAG: aminoacyl-tRNA hydrolase [Candidatus Bruticola sp.]
MNVASAFLVVGLGNPGAEYKNTRHNMGFRAVDLFAQAHHFEFTRKTKLYTAASGTIGSTDIFIIKPRTYMNLSGNAVLSMCTSYGFKPQQIIVISDDFCLPLGRLRIRCSGGSGGHNGLNNIIACLGANNFIRVRLGIGSAPVGSDPINFVLGTFSPNEYEPINDLLQRASEAISYIIECGPEAAMNKFNGQS